MAIDYEKPMRYNLFELMQGSGGGEGYTLPIANENVLGGVKIGEGINIDAGGTISTETLDPYTLPTASASVLGGVKIGNTLQIDNNGVIDSKLTAERNIINLDNVTTLEEIFTTLRNEITRYGQAQVGNNQNTSAKELLSSPSLANYANAIFIPIVFSTALSVILVVATSTTPNGVISYKFLSNRTTNYGQSQWVKILN